MQAAGQHGWTVYISMSRAMPVDCSIYTERMPLSNEMHSLKHHHVHQAEHLQSRSIRGMHMMHFCAPWPRSP